MPVSYTNLDVYKRQTIDGSVGIGPIPTGFGIEAELKISLPGMDRAEAEKLVACLLYTSRCV